MKRDPVIHQRKAIVGIKLRALGGRRVKEGKI